MRPKEAEARASVARPEEGERNLPGAGAGAEGGTAAGGETKSETRLMEAAVERSNMWRAYRQVLKNRGTAGVDAMAVTELGNWLKTNWPQVKQALLENRYLPQAVRKVEIPKASGGKRTLGIPTVVDRLIQQALHQVMQPLFEPEFSESSYGFRPRRKAHQAVQAARGYVAEGRSWVVDLDLEKFFDRVNHDMVMSRVARKVRDERVLQLLRRYLEAGMMEGGVVKPREEGTPQGGPLSPLLSNILLTDLDRELEKRQHRFCRYADDCNVYVRSETAGRRVMAAMRSFLEKKLKLRVNEEKSAVARPWERKFLGYTMSRERKPRLKIAAPSRQRLEEKVRQLMRTARGRSLQKTIAILNPLLRGWVAYFRLVEIKAVLEDLDGWIRRKLRTLLWRQWKRPNTRVRRLKQRGLGEQQAWLSANNGHGPWWNGGAAHMHRAYPKSWFDQMELLSLLDTQRHLQRLS